MPYRLFWIISVILHDNENLISTPIDLMIMNMQMTSNEKCNICIWQRFLLPNVCFRNPLEKQELYFCCEGVVRKQIIVMVQQIIIIISSYDDHTSNPFHKYFGSRYVLYRTKMKYENQELYDSYTCIFWMDYIFFSIITEGIFCWVVSYIP